MLENRGLLDNLSFAVNESYIITLIVLDTAISESFIDCRLKFNQKKIQKLVFLRMYKHRERRLKARSKHLKIRATRFSILRRDHEGKITWHDFRFTSPSFFNAHV